MYIINKKRVVGDTKTRHTIPIGAGDSERSNGINQKQANRALFYFLSFLRRESRSILVKELTGLHAALVRLITERQ
jgi:hypothetical protein